MNIFIILLQQPKNPCHMRTLIFHTLIQWIQIVWLFNIHFTITFIALLALWSLIVFLWEQIGRVALNWHELNFKKLTTITRFNSIHNLWNILPKSKDGMLYFIQKRNSVFLSKYLQSKYYGNINTEKYSLNIDAMLIIS